MIPPYGRTPQEVYNDLNEELKTKGFEFDKYFSLNSCNEQKGSYRFPNDTNFYLESWRDEYSIDAYSESGVGTTFLYSVASVTQQMRTVATVTEQLLNGWPYDESLAQKARDNRFWIFFTTTAGKTKFRITDGDCIRIQDKNDPNDYADVKCRQVKDRHRGGDRVRVCDYPLMDGDYSIREFAQVLEENNKQVIRLPAKRSAYDVAFSADGKNFEWKEVPIADEETMIKNLVGDVIKTGRDKACTKRYFLGTAGAAMFGMSCGDLDSLNPPDFDSLVLDAAFLSSYPKNQPHKTHANSTLSKSKDTSRGR
jgi:hypothetical protein